MHRKENKKSGEGLQANRLRIPFVLFSLRKAKLPAVLPRNYSTV